MERFMKQYEKEYMKMAMLKHEETFRFQVHELHRLYRVQKMMMNDMKSELKRQRLSSDRRRRLDLELPAEEFIGKEDGEGTVEEEDDGRLELTLATGSRRRKKGETSLTSDSGGSLSSSSAESSGMKQVGNEWGMFQMKNRFKRDFHEEEEEEQGRRKEMVNHPPWFLQCLSLNMT